MQHEASTTRTLGSAMGNNMARTAAINNKLRWRVSNAGNDYHSSACMKTQVNQTTRHTAKSASHSEG